MAKETLQKRVGLIRSGKAKFNFGIEGCCVGGWGETVQEMVRIHDFIPSKSDRAYTIRELVNALYYVDGTDRYRWRD